MKKSLAILVVIMIGLTGLMFWLSSSMVDKSGEHDLISVSYPTPNTLVSSPLEVSGQARGNWYFEASFPIELLDANGLQLAVGIGEAQGEWMTTEFVPFKGTLIFSTPSTPTGTLVLKKDNPSGLEEFDDKIEIPVTFNTDTANVRSVKLFYYDESRDKDSEGNTLCSSQGLVSVGRDISRGLSPIQDTIKLLLAGQLTLAEKNSGISTEFPLAGFSLNSANLEEGKLTLVFTDTENRSSGGACRVSILRAQIEATAEQFEEVTEVVIEPAEILQP